MNRIDLLKRSTKGNTERVERTKPIQSMDRALVEIMDYLGRSGIHEIDKGLISRKIRFEKKNLSPEALGQSLTILANMGKSGPFNESDILFFDIETSGTSGSSGIILFMFGCGYFEQGVFTVEQIFLTNPARALEMMKRIRDLFKGKRLLLSFNGKAFDLTIIREKMAYLRMEEKPDFDRMSHFDLLYTGRRLFKKIVESCTLSSLEKNILGTVRTEEDIPGFLIPLAYNQFLHHHRTEDIRKIFYHNQLDIVSLLDLLNYFAQIMENPLSQFLKKDDLALARIFKGHNPTEAEKIYLHIINGNYDVDVRRIAKIRLSLLYRSSGRYEEALSLWQQMIASGESDSFPVVEIAKQLEHRQKDFPAAKKTILDFLERSERGAKLGKPILTEPDRSELQKRLKRLERKISNTR